MADHDTHARHDSGQDQRSDYDRTRGQDRDWRDRNSDWRQDREWGNDRDRDRARGQNQNQDRGGYGRGTGGGYGGYGGYGGTDYRSGTYDQRGEQRGYGRDITGPDRHRESGGYGAFRDHDRDRNQRGSGQHSSSQGNSNRGQQDQGPDGFLLIEEYDIAVPAGQYHHYKNWRDRHTQGLDEDYRQFCRERQQQFDNDFEQWRRNRRKNQSQQNQSGQGQTAKPEANSNQKVSSQSKEPQTAQAGGSDHDKKAKNK